MHDVLYDSLINLDTKSKQLFLFFQMGPSDFVHPETGEKPKNWRMICSAENSEALMDAFEEAEIAPLKYSNGREFKKDNYMRKLTKKEIGIEENKFHTFFDLLPTNLIDFTAEDSQMVRDLIIDFNNEQRLFSREETQLVRSHASKKLTELADPDDKESPEIIDIFVNHIMPLTQETC